MKKKPLSVRSLRKRHKEMLAEVAAAKLEVWKLKLTVDSLRIQLREQKATQTGV